MIIGDEIINFSDEEAGRLGYTSVIDDVAERSITIDGYELNSIFGRNFEIPDYQRGYEWEEEQWEELWGELEQLFNVDTERSERADDVFFGSMFFSRKQTGDDDPRDEVYEVIDGQQRITTLSLVFHILYGHLNDAMSEDPSLFGPLSEEPGSIANLVYRDTGAGSGNDPALEPDRHNKEFYEALIAGKEELVKYLFANEVRHPSTKENAITVRKYLSKLGISEEIYFENIDDNDFYERLDDNSRRPNLFQYQTEWLEEEDGSEGSEEDDSDESDVSLTEDQKEQILDNKIRVLDTNIKLIKAYEFFDDKISTEMEDADPQEQAFAVTNLKNFILKSFHVGYFEVQGNQPRLLMKIFEILNDRGVELKKIDVIRTRIVGRFRGHSTEQEYIDKWENIVEELGKPEIVNDFLQTFFVSIGDVQSRGDTKNRLLEAFSEESGGALEPRLTSTSAAQSFLEDLEKYSKYYHHLIDPDNYGIDLGPDGDDEIEAECNRIITRLNKAGTSIWEPLVLAVYHDVREDAIGQQILLREILRDIESMALRSFAAMDTNIRDSAYADAIGEYHDNGLEGDIRETLTDIEADDPGAVGEELVVAMCQSDWRRGWGKSTLRKICAENMEDEDEMVRRNLVSDDNLVHLEHVFPQTPPTDGSDDYKWFINFFQTGSIDNGDEETETSETEEEVDIQSVVQSLIENENSDALEEIAEDYINDLGNLLLLRYRENIQIGNDLYGDKLVRYNLTDGFCDLRSNQYVCETAMAEDDFDDVEQYSKVVDTLDALTNNNWEEYAEEFDVDVDSREDFENELKSKKEELSDSVSAFHSMWNYDQVTEHRADLLETLCDSIAFSDDEFEEVDFQELSQDETERRNSVIATNMQRRI
ncbi:DUF262 domain-containing protein [Halorubrum sp. SS5]|nr:DUF262 domain-containing protein [Halorubrum sp. SS5]